MIRSNIGISLNTKNQQRKWQCFCNQFTFKGHYIHNEAFSHFVPNWTESSHIAMHNVRIAAAKYHKGLSESHKSH